MVSQFLLLKLITENKNDEIRLLCEYSMGFIEKLIIFISQEQIKNELKPISERLKSCFNIKQSRW